MAKLTIRLRGEKLAEVDLQDGQEYLAGRATDSQIVLPNERGISRHHLKFYQRDGHWICEALSKFVLPQKGGESFEIIELVETCAFSVQPFEFQFETADPQQTVQEPGPKENLPAFFQPRKNPVSSEPLNDATMAGSSNLIPYIRVSYPDSADDEVFKLEGQLWTAGRDPDCEVHIDSNNISRKHFELAQTKEGYFITDLGSSNGTKLNGQKLPPHEPTRIESGDELSIKNISLIFEIRDAQFGNKAEKLPILTFDPMLLPAPAPWPNPQNFEQTQLEPKKSRPKNKVRMALVALVPLLLILIILPDTKKTESPKREPSGGASVAFENLSNEQRLVIKDSFNLARSQYVQGRYELCLTELAKVHELIPQYENSKELQSFCEQGRELLLQQRDIERKDRERAMIEEQITGYVEACKSKFTPTISVDEARQCLADAIELAPEHHLVVELLHMVQAQEQERKQLAEERERLNQKAAEGEAHFNRAKALRDKGKLFKAAAEYEKFIATPYPKVETQKSQAKRELASIQGELKVKVSALLEQCRALGSQNKYKDAYLKCNEALDEEPNNSGAKTLRSQMHSELRREMKSIYEDSVLEESLGNVDSAKEKWQRILKENLDFDDYSIKAKGKLKRYGIGF